MATWLNSSSTGVSRPKMFTSTFSFILKTSPAAILLRQAAGLDKGASTTGREQVGTITDAQLAEIATTKLKDLNTDDLEAAKKQVAGTARSMGITVAS